MRSGSVVICVASSRLNSPALCVAVVLPPFFFNHADARADEIRTVSEVSIIMRVIVMGLKPLLALPAIMQRQRLG